MGEYVVVISSTDHWMALFNKKIYILGGGSYNTQTLHLEDIIKVTFRLE